MNAVAKFFGVGTYYADAMEASENEVPMLRKIGCAAAAVFAVAGLVATPLILAGKISAPAAVGTALFSVGSVAVTPFAAIAAATTLLALVALAAFHFTAEGSA